MRIYEYMLKFKDEGSPDLDRLARAAGVTENTVDKLNTTLNKASGTTGKTSTEVNKLKESAIGADKAITGLGGKFKGWLDDAKGQMMSIPGAGLLTNPLVAAGGGLVAAGKSALDFERNMAKVNATAMLSGPELKKLGDQLQNMALETGSDLNQVPVAFEGILSAVGDTDLSLKILDASLKGAKAGFTDVKVVAEATSKVLSIVGQDKTNAAEVMDTLFAAKRMGAGEFQDFANYLPGVLTGANALGFEMGEVAGAFSYLTTKTDGAATSSVYLNNAFTALGKSDVRDKMEKLGVTVFDSSGKVRPMIDIISDLSNKLKAFGDNSQAKANFLEQAGFTDAQAKSAIIALTGDIDKLRETMAATQSPAGEMDKALKATGHTLQELEKFWSKIQKVMVFVGGIVLPALSFALGIVNTGLDWILKYGDYIAAVIGGISLALIVANASSIAASIGFGLWAGSVWLTNVALVALRANLNMLGIGLLITAVSLLIMYFVNLYKEADSFKAMMGGIMAVVGVVADKFIGLGKVILGAFTFDPAMMSEGITQMSVATERIAKKGFAGIYQEGHDALVAAAGKDQNSDSKGLLEKGATQDSASLGANTDLQAGMDSVAKSEQARHVTVHIGKLNETIQINSSTLREGASEAADTMQEFLVRSVAGAERALAR